MSQRLFNSKTELKKSIAREETNLRKYHHHVKQLKLGKKVSHLSLPNAKKKVEGLTQVIRNKKRLLRNWK